MSTSGLVAVRARGRHWSADDVCGAPPPPARKRSCSAGGHPRAVGRQAAPAAVAVLPQAAPGLATKPLGVPCWARFVLPSLSCFALYASLEYSSSVWRGEIHSTRSAIYFICSTMRRFLGKTDACLVQVDSCLQQQQKITRNTKHNEIWARGDSGER